MKHISATKDDILIVISFSLIILATKRRFNVLNGVAMLGFYVILIFNELFLKYGLN